MDKELFHKKFGPKLIEAIFEKMLEELNELRTACSLPPRTKQEFLKSLGNKEQTIDNY